MSTTSGSSLRPTPIYTFKKTAGCGSNRTSSPPPVRGRSSGTAKLKEDLAKKNRERNANKGYNANVGVQITDEEDHRPYKPSWNK